MPKFDWRHFEPPDQRTREQAEYWPRFVSDDWRDRFREVPIGRDAWAALVESLRGIGLGRGVEAQELCFRAVDRFYDQCLEIPSRPAAACVFISHQRADAARGERVACIADHFTVDYWLDVHDPTLRLANTIVPPGPVRSALIAGIVEMALLNCTHVIALHTSNSGGSRWIPYEFGRAKDRQIRSRQAASWFQSGQAPANCGEYLHLAVETFAEAEVEAWLVAEAGGSRAPVARHCMSHHTSELT